VNIKTFYLILFFLVVFGVFNSFKTPLFDVTGKAVMSAGIQNPMYEDSIKTIPISGAKILVAKGKILVKPTKESIPINKIRSIKRISMTNDEGIFKFRLEKGEYTFFILLEDQAYLNSFDGKGYFLSKIIRSNRNDIVILDNRGILY
tara:strand:- start:228 stop:668 length:441 start_codon:yes stop_codon:yes gene_type:complete